MKEELTRGFEKSELETMIAFYQNNDCSRRTARELATALLEEMEKPKVWDGAPEDALQAQIIWFTKNGGYIGMKTYTREIPKTRARIMAEDVECPFVCCQFYDKDADGKCGGECHGGSAQEAACLWYNLHLLGLNKYAAELKGKA